MKKSLYIKFVAFFLILGFIGFFAVSMIGPSLVENHLEDVYSGDLYREASSIAENRASKYYQQQASLDSVAMNLKTLSIYQDAEIWLISPQGEILLQLANQVLPQISQALQACNEPQQTRLRIAIECHSCIQWLTPALENFHKNWPQVEMDFKSGVTFDPQPALQQGELDLVMTSDILPRSGLHYSPMFDYEVRLVLAPDHPLAAKTRITPEDLASETLLIYPVQRSRLDVWRHFLQPAGVSPSLKSVDNTLLLIQMVAARMGIAALPHWVVESFERQGLVVTKTLGEGLWSRLYAAVRDGEQRQPITEAFIRSARNHACDHLPFVKSAERPTYDAPTVRPGSPARL